jgi:hypothetical protein
VKKNRNVIGFGVAAAGTAAFIKGFTMATEKASKLSNMSKEAKINVEGLQVALLLGDKEGAAQEQVVAALKNLNSRTVDAKNGASNYQVALKRLNIELDSFTKLSTEKKLQEIARGYMQTGEDAQAYRDILTILGEDAGPKMIGVLQKMGADGFGKLNEAMKESGKILKEDVVKGLKDAEDAAKNAKQELSGRLSTGMGNISLLLGFGKKEDVRAYRSQVADGMTLGLTDYTSSNAEYEGKLEDKRGFERRLEKEIAQHKANLDRLNGVTPESKKESRQKQLERINKEEQTKKSNAEFVKGIFTAGRELISKQSKSQANVASLKKAVASVPVSSLQSIGGGGGVSSVGMSQIQVLKSSESLLQQIAANTMPENMAGPPKPGAVAQ